MTHETCRDYLRAVCDSVKIDLLREHLTFSMFTVSGPSRIGAKKYFHVEGPDSFFHTASACCAFEAKAKAFELWQSWIKVNRVD